MFSAISVIMFGLPGKKKITPNLQAKRYSAELNNKSRPLLPQWQWALLLSKTRQIALICTIIALITIVIWSFRQHRNSLITKVRVIAPYTHISPAPLQKAIADHIAGTFFGIDVATLRQELIAIPWVHEVYIRRKWPDTLIIKIDEQQPIAQWKNEALLGIDGALFTPPKNSFPPSLPLLLGPEESVREVVTTYQEMERILFPLHFKVAQLDLNEQGNWHITMRREDKTGNDITVFLGNDNILAKLQGFVAAYPKIVLNDPERIIETIDLRYKNGIAVKWEGQETKN